MDIKQFPKNKRIGNPNTDRIYRLDIGMELGIDNCDELELGIEKCKEKRETRY